MSVDTLTMDTEKRQRIIERLKREYPEGARVELVSMDDPYTKMAPGIRGTVRCIDDCGTIFVNWDNGSSLGVVYGKDTVKKVAKIRFIDSHYKELFEIYDGDKVTIEYEDGREPITKVCSYIDEYHFRFGSDCYHICQFAERMESINAKYSPAK